MQRNTAHCLAGKGWSPYFCFMQCRFHVILKWGSSLNTRGQDVYQNFSHVTSIETLQWVGPYWYATQRNATQRRRRTAKRIDSSAASGHCDPSPEGGRRSTRPWIGSKGIQLMDWGHDELHQSRQLSPLVKHLYQKRLSLRNSVQPTSTLWTKSIETRAPARLKCDGEVRMTMVRTRRRPGRYITRSRNSGIVTQMRQIQFVRTMFQTDDRHRTTVLSRSCWYKQSRRKFRPHRQRPPITEDRGWPHCTPEGNVSLVVEQKEKAFIAPTRIVAWEEDGRSVRILRRRYIIPEWCWIWARSPAGRSSLAMSLGESFPAGQDWQAGKSEEKHGQNWASPFVDQRGCLHIVALRCVGKRRNFVWLSCSNCPKNVRARHVLIISRRFSEGLGHGRDGFGFSNIFQWKTLFF